MEKEIQVPNFVNENYKKNKEEQKELERQIEIRKIKNILQKTNIRSIINIRYLSRKITVALRRKRRCKCGR